MDRTWNICLSLILPIFAAVYNMIPVFYVYLLRKKEKWVRRSDGKEELKRIISFLPLSDKQKSHVLNRIEEAGIGDERTWMYWLIISKIFPLVLLVLMLISGYRLIDSIVCSAGCYVLPEIWLNRRIKDRKGAFERNAYKIYSFLHTQISSGVKATDAVRGMYEIADHQLIRDCFIRFTARYELTLDLEGSLEIITRSFRGYDGEMMCVCIKQCIDSGSAGKTLLKMEQMMFSKYFNILQTETDKYKTRILITGLIGLSPLIILLCAPMIYEAVSGFMTMITI